MQSMSIPTTLESQPLHLEKDPFGQLVLLRPSGERVQGVVPVRAFPIQSPDDGVSLVSQEGHEVAWIERLSSLAPEVQALIRQELGSREFMPVIEKILAVSSLSTPCTWRVRTDRGNTEFLLRGDEDIRRIGKNHALLVADAHGIQYLVRDQLALDAASRKILDRFL